MTVANSMYQVEQIQIPQRSNIPMIGVGEYVAFETLRRVGNNECALKLYLAIK